MNTNSVTDNTVLKQTKQIVTAVGNAANNYKEAEEIITAMYILNMDRLLNR